jgi:hypothetical protein
MARAREGKKAALAESAESGQATDASMRATRRTGSGKAETRLRRALFRRVGRQIRASLNAMELEDLVSLVELETPIETLAQLVAMRPDAALSTTDDYSLRLLRGAQRKRELLQRLGGTLSSGEVAALLDRTVPAVKQRLRRRTLFAIPLSHGEWGFPAAQFTPEGEVREGLSEVLWAFAEDEDPWAIVLLLAADDPASQTGTILEHLANERTRRIAIGRARSYGTQGAA